MRMPIPCTALGLVLLAGTTAAHAQTVITRQVSSQPVETIITQQPVQTVQTVTTTRTVRPARAIARRHDVTTAHRQVVTTRRTITTERVVPAIPAPVVAETYPQSLYDAATPPLYDAAASAPPPALYDTAAPMAGDVANPAYAAPAGNTIPTYRYVYEPDRILVIDPTTNIAIQALPR